MFDISISLLALPGVVVLAGVLVILNPILNPGPLLFRQKRMGRGLHPFTAIKFRTMRDASEIKRRAHDPLEAHRITPLGSFLRRTRLDELPQFLNILTGDMSFIGPRPDFVDHAQIYLDQIPGYAERHKVKPGLSGLAQVTLGYAQDAAQVRAKVACDLDYIRRASIGLDVWILWRTLVTVLTSRGQ